MKVVKRTALVVLVAWACLEGFAESLPAAAERLERELEAEFLDTNGVLRCSSGASDVTIWESKGPYENVGIVNGTFLQAMCAKYAVTGDRRDLVKARRTYRAIARVYELSQAMGEGYFCKPWGWKCQDETSSDQFVYAMLGMDAYYPLASQAEQSEIADRIPKMARWWISRNYKYKYLGKPLNWQRCRFLTFSALAEKYAKTGEFTAELKRLLVDPSVTNDLPYRCSIARGAFPAPGGKTFYQVSPGTAEIGFNAVSAVLTTDPGNVYANVVMRSCYDLAKNCIQSDGTAYRFMDRQPDGAWREMPPDESFTDPPSSDARFNSPLLRFHGPYRVTAAGAVLGMVLLSKHYAPAAEWVSAHAERLFRAMAKNGFERTDPHHVQPPEIVRELARFPKHCEAQVAWLQGYWTWQMMRAERCADLIDPMIGAVTYPESGLRGQENIHGFGKTFPGATTPFGLVQLSPDTVTGGDNGPGYSYAHKTIEGFGFTHMSGIGWYGEFGNLQVMPSDLDKSRFSHSEERAEAGYYRVRLADAGVLAEATAARRSGMLRFTWEKSGEGVVRMDLARRIGELARVKRFGGQSFRMTGERTFAGEIACDHRDGGWGRGTGGVDYTLRFAGRLSRTPGQVSTTGGSSNCVVRMTFPVAAGERVVLHVALSFDAPPETPLDLDFDAMRRSADERWTEALSGVEVEGGTERERTIFATALYHAFIDPREIGRGNLHGHPFVRRTVFSGWDVFRSEMPLLTLLRPDVVSDTINSMMDTVVSGKRKTLPRWDIFGCPGGCMIGQPLVSVMADAWEKGIRTFDGKLALDLACRSLEAEGNDRKLGYTPDSLSDTLEYAYADWCCGRLAEMLGEKAVARRYYDCAKAYTNCWSKDVGWMRTRRADGGWLAWQGREKQGQGCEESNPWQQGWFVPHDVEGLIRLMGGRGRFTAELEKFFGRVPDDFRWNDAYNHPNEPCHTLPYLFAFSEKPEEVGRWTRRICEKAYGTGPFGLCGNEDVGQMSAWYVLSAIGLHPVCPGDGRWYVTAPAFRKATIRLDPKYYPGGTFTIRAPDAGPGVWRIAGLRLNGKPLSRRWVSTHEVSSGGILDIDLRP